MKAVYTLKMKKMGKLTNWFKAKYKIVPTYTSGKKISGYMPLKSSWVGYYVPMAMLQDDGSGRMKQVDAWFTNYADAINFLKHETKIITHEEIFGTKCD